MLIAAGMTAGLALFPACAEDEPAEEPTLAEQAAEAVDQSSNDDVAQDDEWELVGITGLGESELNHGDGSQEAAVLRFNFMLGDTAVSCLVATDSDYDFPDQGFLNPELCFIDGDPNQPLAQSGQPG